MLVGLTAKLIAVPEHAWPRLVAAVDGGERLPPPLGHVGALAAISVLATLLGAAIAPGHTPAGVVGHALAATAGYAGGGAAAVMLAPVLLRPASGAPDTLARYASASVVPLMVCGVLNLVPLAGLGLLWTLGGAALAARSAFLGASQFLALEGDRRRNAAAVVTLLAATPILVSVALRVLFLP